MKFLCGVDGGGGSVCGVWWGIFLCGEKVGLVFCGG